jgi:hypothetical protein
MYADVLDDAIVAVDFQLRAALPGLRSKGVLSAAIAHPKAVGWKFTILNPARPQTERGKRPCGHANQCLSRENEKTFLNELTARSLIRSKKENPRRLS